jgi:hypothetical protein
VGRSIVANRLTAAATPTLEASPKFDAFPDIILEPEVLRLWHPVFSELSVQIEPLTVDFLFSGLSSPSTTTMPRATTDSGGFPQTWP